MDITKLDTKPLAEQGSELTLKHPGTGDDLPCRITLKGTDSQAFQQASNRISNKRIQKAAKRGKLDKDALNIEELMDETLDQLVACTVSWTGIEVNGLALECTPENARQLYTDYRWVREQAESFLQDRSNFLGK